MKTRGRHIDPLSSLPEQPGDETGFGLAEFLIAALIILAISAGLFTMMARVQTSSGYQNEVLSVIANTRMAMELVERYIAQAGNRPAGGSFTPVTIVSSTAVHLCSDLTGSAGGNLGDPDGDVLDADEDVIIQYNSTARSIELVLPDASVQTVATYISGFSLQYYDKDGMVTTDGANVERILVTINGSSQLADPQTRKTFGITLSNNVRVAMR